MAERTNRLPDVATYLASRSKERASVFARYYRLLRGQRLSYTNPKSPNSFRPFLLQIMDDAHENKVVKKARQVGMSEAQVNEVLWFVATHDFVNVIYTFPRDKQLRPFSQTRVDTAIDESPYISLLCPNNPKTRNVYQKRFLNHSNIFMVSAWESGLGEGMAADMVCFDEYDRMEEDVETAFAEALSASRYGWLRRFSTPTIPARGVAKWYTISDQHRYFLKCEHCGEWQYLTFEENIIQVKPGGVKEHLQYVEDGTFAFVCRKCHRDLNRLQVGEWVPAYEGRDIRGYHISQLYCPWISADDIYRKRLRYVSDQLFANYVLGEEYCETGALLTRADFLACINPNIGPSLSRQGCVMVSVGIDWGRTNWVVVLGLLPNGRERVLNVFWVPDTPVALEQVKIIASRIAVYDPDIVICDTGYGKDRNAEMLAIFPGRVWGCEYTDRGYLATWKESQYTVRVNRTLSLRQAILAFKKRQVEVWGMDEAMQMLCSHLEHLTIVQDEDEETGEITETVASMGPDHLAHAFNYAHIALEAERFQVREGGGFEYRFMTEGEYVGDGPRIFVPQPGQIALYEDFVAMWDEATGWRERGY
ncbi:phage terminase large subunit family protein [Candidatus Caldatribacterium sp.]|uniref:phage terminase large subunit family protein n=1 Tax=Candidatus Caldatribacterium sp. TaxID=2282143 RepID=UPI00383C4547|nr:phage terminase large subunit family protein [Candidatus Caldatribacterium sp.]